MPSMIRLLLSTSPMMRGDDVLMVQRRLSTVGIEVTQDGLYGDGTANAVRRFQRSRNLEVDGIVGPNTWKALFDDAGAAVPLLPPGPLEGENLDRLGNMHGHYQDGCRWRLDVDGIEVDGEGLLTFSTPERTQAASVITRFRQEMNTALATHHVPVELVIACICAESGGQPQSLRLEPGCDRDNPENTPSRVSEGLMQTLLSTARSALRQPGLRLQELQRPEVSILAGTAYIAQQSTQTRFDPPLVAAAYNAGSLRYNASSANRWRLLQYPIGTSRHVDRFLRSFNAAMTLIETTEWPDHVISFRKILKGGPIPGQPQAGPVVTTVAAVSAVTTGVTVSSATPTRSDIAAAIRDAATQVGVDAEILAAMAFIESSLRVDAASPTSSAFGLFQFINDTWNGVVRDHGAAFGVTVAQRRDLRAQCLMGAAFLLDNTSVLRNALGRAPVAAECYAAHFFGAPTAARLLRGGPDVPADDALGDRAERIIGANRSIFLDQGRTRTVGEVMVLFDTKMGKALEQARALLGATPPAPVPQTAPATGAEPPWLAIARAEISQKEAQGAADNPRIVEYFSATTLGPQPDSVSWCGAFVSFCLRKAGVIDKGSARAADWLAFGDRLSQPRPGCIVVLKPQAAGASGHVGFWVKQEGGRIHLLAGNQNDRVDITPYPESQLQVDGLRWPHGSP